MHLGWTLEAQPLACSSAKTGAELTQLDLILDDCWVVGSLVCDAFFFSILTVYGSVFPDLYSLEQSQTEEILGFS